MITTLATDVIARTSTGEAVMFWVLGTVALIGALGVVLAVNAVYSAMFLAMTMIILAVFYMIQDALFLGVVQVVVYTGAVMMLFLFVLIVVCIGRLITAADYPGYSAHKGASLLKGAHETDYGGYSGYFGDPDNHPWEVVVAPGIEVGDDRRVHLPD